MYAFELQDFKFFEHKDICLKSSAEVDMKDTILFNPLFKDCKTQFSINRANPFQIIVSFLIGGWSCPY